MRPDESKPQPVELEIDRERGQLQVRWRDGGHTVLTLAALRRACPCATCRAMRAEQADNRLVVISPPADEQAQVSVAEAELVGRYALRITWGDGHDAGIYDFVLLRSLGDQAASG